MAPLVAGLASLAACQALPAKGLVRPVPIVITASAVPLDGQNQDRSDVGALRFRGGLQMTSDDAHFGGLSVLTVSEDGQNLTALSDMGYWLRGRLTYDEAGDLSGLGDASMGPLLDLTGRPVAGKEWGDAESMAPGPDGSVIVAFEQHPRLWKYSTWERAPVALKAPADLRTAPANGGLEALTRLRDGRYLALSEGYAVAGGNRGWVGGPGHWFPLTYDVGEAFAPTDAATLANGDVLVLERRFPPVGARIRRVKAADIAPGARLRGVEIARLEGSLSVDNMEGMDVRTGGRGETLIYLVSDDNFSPLQRTLLMMFELRE